MVLSTPVLLFVAATVCSIVGRLLLARAAFGVGKAWGVAVLIVPFAPLIFRLNYKELAHEGKRWRLATVICMLFLVAIGTSGNGTGSTADLLQKMTHQDEAAVLAEVDATDARNQPKTTAKVAAATPAPKSALMKVAAFLLPPGLLPADAPSEVAVTRVALSTPSPAILKVAVADAAPPAVVLPVPVIPATPAPLPTAERFAANQREFARLGEVYAALKLERGYQRQSDPEAMAAFNVAAAKYQAALAAARAEQVELNKLFASAKK